MLPTRAPPTKRHARRARVGEPKDSGGYEHTKSAPADKQRPPPRSVSAFVIVFIEIPLLLRICPTSSTFDAYIRKISTNYMRAAAYGIMALIQWLSIIPRATSLIAEAIVLTATGLCYLLAAVKGQAFVGSKTLGGQGVAQMMV